MSAIIVTEMTGQLNPWGEWQVWGNSNGRQSRYPTAGGTSRRRSFVLGRGIVVATIFESVTHCRCRCECCSCHQQHKNFSIRFAGQSYQTPSERFPTFEGALGKLKEMIG